MTMKEIQFKMNNLKWREILFAGFGPIIWLVPLLLVDNFWFSAAWSCYFYKYSKKFLGLK